jgi:hypothetical protein
MKKYNALGVLLLGTAMAFAQEGEALETIYKLVVKSSTEVDISAYAVRNREEVLLDGKKTVLKGEAARRFFETHPNYHVGATTTSMNFSDLDPNHSTSRTPAEQLADYRIWEEDTYATHPGLLSKAQYAETGARVHAAFFIVQKKTRTIFDFYKNSHGNYLVSFPQTDDQYKKIFGDFDSGASSSINELFKNSFSGHPHLFQLESEAGLINTLNNISNEKPVILIGHNSGGAFVLPDGSSMSIADIDNLAGKRRLRIIYLSCYAASYTANPAYGLPITYEEAMQVANRIDKAYGADPAMLNSEYERATLNGILETMRKNIELKNRSRLVFVLFGAGAAGGGIYYIKERS